MVSSCAAGVAAWICPGEEYTVQVADLGVTRGPPAATYVRMIRSILRPAGCLAFALAIFAASAVDAAGPRVIAAVRLGTAGHDNLEGLAIDGDGEVLVVGNAAGPLVGLPAGMPHRITAARVAA